MTKKPHIAAVVQARMRSTRLPGKVLKPIAGEPLLWHILHRLRKSELIETICVATTRDAADDELAAYAEAQGAKVVRGPDDDVLGRLALAMYAIDPDIIVRVNADAPLVDAAYIDYLIREMLRHQADFVMPKAGVATVHDGAEPMSRWAIDKLIVKAHNDPIAREHVTAYFKIHTDFVKIAQVDVPEKWRFSGARLSIDTPADMTFIEAVYERLHARAGEATLSDLVQLLDREPGLLDLNAVPQRPTGRRRALIRADEDPVLGMARIKRSIALARALRDRAGFEVRFAVNEDDAAAIAQEAGFDADVMLQRVREIDWLLPLVEGLRPELTVLDICSDLSATSVMRLRGADTIVATVEDMSARRLSADAAFYAPLPQVFGLNWEGAEAEPYVGWEWLPLPRDGAQPLARQEGRPHVIVSMGTACEPMTLACVRALARLDAAFDATVVIGPAAPRELEGQIARHAPQFAIVRSADDLPKLMTRADLALVGYGPVACELGALGVPAIYVCMTEQQALCASAFERVGMGYSLVGMTAGGEAKIGAAAADLLGDARHLREMSAAGLMNLDGRGAERIAARLCQLADERAEAFAEAPSVSKVVAAAG